MLVCLPPAVLAHGCAGFSSSSVRTLALASSQAALQAAKQQLRQNLQLILASFVVQMKKSQTDEGTEEEEEACCVSIVCNLLLGLQRGSRRERVASKFVENEFEKCDRLMEIFTRRSARVAAAEVGPASVS